MEDIPKKQQIILETARELFWKYGFKRVSIEEICQKATVSKMTFYRFYSNKIDLAKAVFDNEVEKGMIVFRNIIEGDGKPSDKMKQLLTLKLKGSNDISKEFLMDFYSNPDLGLKSYIEEKIAVAWQKMRDDFHGAQQQGLFRTDIRPELVIYLSQKMSEIAADQKLLSIYNNPQEAIMEIVNFFLYGLSPHS